MLRTKCFEGKDLFDVERQVNRYFEDNLFGFKSLHLTYGDSKVMVVILLSVKV